MKKTIGVSHSTIVEISSALLLIFMIHTLVSSYVQLQSLKNLLAFYTRNTTTVAWMIVIVELVLTVLLFFPRTRTAGLIGVLILMLFAASIMWLYPRYPHHFGGIINKIAKSQRRILVGIVALVAIIGIVFSILKKRQSTPVANNEHVVVYT